jgi:hypothetical protein
MAEMGSLEVDATKLQLNLRGALHDFLALYKQQPGWYYPIFGHVGDTHSGNISFLAAMGLIGDKEDQGKKLLRDAGLLNFRDPRGYQVLEKVGSDSLRNLIWLDV